MKEIFSIVLVIIGALIGAGFASGQEIYSFFYSYGVIGLIGIIFTYVLISLTIYKCLNIICKKEINDYNEFISLFVKNKKIAKVISVVLNTLLLITFYIMVAGFGAYFEQELGLNKIIGNIIIIIMVSIVFFKSIKGVLKVSQYIVPVLILCILVMGCLNLATLNLESNIMIMKSGWLISSILYCSYNMILLIPALISLKSQIKNESNIKYIAVISGILMIIMSIMIYMLLLKSDVNISTLEMPIVYVVRSFFKEFKIIYAFIILASIFTTAISIGIGYLQNMCKSKKSYPQLVLFMCITSLIISNLGFSKLVNLLYPIFGYIGIVQIFLILMYGNLKSKNC